MTAPTRNSKLYIAGPMTGYDHYNFPAFHKTADRLRSRGYLVHNPAEKEAGADGLPNPAKLPVQWGGTRKDLSPGEIRRYDFFDMLNCDGVVVLKGWEASPGARLEVAVAMMCGLPVYSQRLALLSSKIAIQTRLSTKLWQDVGNTQNGKEI